MPSAQVASTYHLAQAPTDLSRSVVILYRDAQFQGHHALYASVTAWNPDPHGRITVFTFVTFHILNFRFERPRNTAN